MDERKLPPWLDGTEAEPDAYEGFAAWKRWLALHIDDALPDYANAFVDHMDGLHEAYLYNVMSRLWDDHPSLRAAGKGVAR